MCIDAEAKHKSTMKYQYPAKSKSKLGGVDECVEVFSDFTCTVQYRISKKPQVHSFTRINMPKPAIQCDNKNPCSIQMIFLTT